MTWPLSRQMGDMLIGGTGDNLYYVWLIGWLQKAIFSLHINPLVVPIFNFPYGWNLAFSEITPVNSLPAVLISYLGNPTLAYNLILLTSYVLTGYFTFL